MYNVSITNDYIYSLFLDGSKQMFVPPNGGHNKVTNWGNHIINVPGMGDMNFLDLGDHKLEQYTNPDIPWTEATWGGLIRYRSYEVYFRYEGQGEVELVVDRLGEAKFHFKTFGGMVVALDDISVV